MHMFCKQVFSDFSPLEFALIRVTETEYEMGVIRGFSDTFSSDNLQITFHNPSFSERLQTEQITSRSCRLTLTLDLWHKHEMNLCGKLKIERDIAKDLKVF